MDEPSLRRQPAARPDADGLQPDAERPSAAQPAEAGETGVRSGRAAGRRRAAAARGAGGAQKTAPRRRELLTAVADLIGAGAAVYLLCSMLLRLAAGGVLKLISPGATFEDAAGVPEFVPGLLNLILAVAGLWLAVRFLKELCPAQLRPGCAMTDPRDRRLWLFLPVFLGVSLLGDVLSAALQRLLAAHTGYTAPAAVQLPDSGLALLLYFAAMCVAPAILEELFCRGMMQGMLRRWGVWFSIVVSSVVFTLLHADIAQMPSIFVLSVFLGLVAYATDSLMPGMVLHFVNNVAAFIFLLTQQKLDGVKAFGMLTYLVGVMVLAAAVCVGVIHRLGLMRTLRPIPQVYDPKNRQKRVLRLATAPLFMVVMLWLAVRAVLPLFARG